MVAEDSDAGPWWNFAGEAHGACGVDAHGFFDDLVETVTCF